MDIEDPFAELFAPSDDDDHGQMLFTDEKPDKSLEEKQKPSPVKQRKKKSEFPRITLNPNRLKHLDKGLLVLNQEMSSYKFSSKRGMEEQELNKLMSGIERWAHRLFPAAKFDDFLSQVEYLGFKGKISTFLKNMRDDARDGLVNPEFELNEKVDLDPDVPSEIPLTVDALPTPFSSLDTQENSNEITITDEQRSLMEEKRLKALARRREKKLIANSLLSSPDPIFNTPQFASTPLEQEKALNHQAQPSATIDNGDLGSVNHKPKETDNESCPLSPSSVFHENDYSESIPKCYLLRTSQPDDVSMAKSIDSEITESIEKVDSFLSK